MAELVIARSVPAIPENVSALRHAITELAERAGASERASGDVALAVGEACGNVVMHAYPPGETGPLIVEGRVLGEGELEVVVADQGRGVAPRPDSAGVGVGPAPLSSPTQTPPIPARDGGGGARVEK